MKKRILILAVILVVGYVLYNTFCLSVLYYIALPEGESSLQRLVEGLGDRRESVRMVVIGRLVRVDCIDALIDHGLVSTNPHTKEGGALVLIRLFPQLGLPDEKKEKLKGALYPNMCHPDPLVRVQSARAIWKIFHDKNVLDVYLSTFDESDRRLCYFIFLGIGAMRADGEPAMGFLDAQLQSESASIRTWASRALEGVQDPKSDWFGD